ncbi:MAG: DUF2971 domain-containing protein, partial [bacterium]
RLIFRNKTLRLNSLRNVDDAEEGLADIFGNMQRYVFVSSWTRDKAENIPLWSLYTPDMKGVRIGIDPEKIYLEYNEQGEVSNIHSVETISCYQNGQFLFDVDYGDNFIAELFSRDGSISQSNMERLGRTKSRSWEFQKECRFILYGLHRNNMKPHFVSARSWFFERILHKDNCSINHIDLMLSDTVWEDADILIGPAADLNDEQYLSSLINEYYPNSRINLRKSRLNIRPRRR